MLRRNTRGIKIPFGSIYLSLDPLLPIMIILIGVLFAKQYFPRTLYASEQWVYWTLGLATSTLLTLSILIHELGHVFAARIRKLPIERVHIYLFGGMAELKRRPSTPLDEFLVAVMGPAASILLAGFLWLFLELSSGIDRALFVMLRYVLLMNLLLGLFNLIPIFPLDGGRILRAAIWAGNHRFYKSSIKTYLIGSRLIALLFLAALLTYFLRRPDILLWLSVLAIYLAYTVLQGKQELMRAPTLEKMLLPIDQGHSISEMVEEMHRYNGLLEKSVIPVFMNNHMPFVLFGDELAPALKNDDGYQELLKPAAPGMFIDLKDISTFTPEIVFAREYVPVFSNGRFKGIGDAYELQFWMMDGGDSKLGLL